MIFFKCFFIKNKVHFFGLLIGLFLSNILCAQTNFTRKDSLRGGMRPARSCFDVLHYGLNIRVDPLQKFIVGHNEIEFKIINKTNQIQLDLFENMQVDSIVFEKQKLHFEREFGAVFVKFEHELEKNSTQKIRFYYSGNPTIAKNAPWDGGFVFDKDQNNQDFVGVACQGDGGSLWFPCKDSQSDEPDLGVSIKVAVPNGLTNVSNGRFKATLDLQNGYSRWDWEVVNPINIYDITINIAKYVHFGENYKGLDLDYYVLEDDLERAKIQFEQVKAMMDCFQSKFGEYPFAKDGFKLVQTPYLGMEHQSAVAYGNKFQNGYLGRDLSGTGVGFLFDFILVHESGHEWFGNSISASDSADMWIHEGFTCYSESVFLECNFGFEKAQTYINGLKKNIKNDRPIIGQYGVGNEGSGDMYYKAALMLNTLRFVINDDQKWWTILQKYCQVYRHKIIDTQTVVAFFNKESGVDLTPIFNQYLGYKNLPKLEIVSLKNKVRYRWNCDVPDFKMPIDVEIEGSLRRIYPTNIWKKMRVKKQNIKVLENRFLINLKNGDTIYNK